MWGEQIGINDRKTCFSKHFIKTEVRAIGLKSFMTFALFDFGTGDIFEVFQAMGI